MARTCLRTRPELDPASKYGLPHAGWSYAELPCGFAEITAAFVNHVQDFLLPLRQRRVHSKW